ncbi:hypothetical protein D3C80_878770 [compost metagenome]
MGLLLTEGQLLCLRFQLCQRMTRGFALRDLAGQPGEEINPGCAVGLMTFAIACQFNRVFLRLHHCDWISLPENFTLRLNGKTQCDRCGISIHPDAFAFGNLLAATDKIVLG